MTSTTEPGIKRDSQGFIVLKRTCSSLYEKTAYLDKKRDLIINRITEYDLRHANTSSLRGAKLLPEKEIQSIEELPRHDRQVVIGKMIAKNPRIGDIIKNSITVAKRELFSRNNIQDQDVLSIKNDAIYVVGRRLKELTFGSMEFRPKNVYDAYLFLERLEIYYGKADDVLDIKGISDTIVGHPDHVNGMVRFMKDCMGYLLNDRRDALRRYLIEFSEDYKAMKLPVEYYREMSGMNAYRTVMEVDSLAFHLDLATDADRDIIDGIYNYRRFILPMIQRFI